jgi:hypothetical protein
VSGPADRSSAEELEDALRLDAAIDVWLADRSLQARADDEIIDDGVGGTARVLASSLPRLHPRFGFEERLVHRLREEAGALRLSDQDRGWATVLAFPIGEQDDDGPGTSERSWRPGRRSMIGALASAASVALTLVGAVFVFLWRRARGGDASEGMA